MAEFYSRKSQRLFDNVVWLPQAGAQAGPTGRPPNSYAYLTDEGAFLIDAVFSWTMDGIAEIAKTHRPVSFLLTHGDVADQADALEDLRRTYGAPFFLHPDDAADPRTHDKGASFMNPREDDLLASAGLDIIPMPYHSPGSLMFYTYEEGGVLFAGDAAVAPGPLQAPEPARLQRPKTGEALDDENREAWRVLAATRLIGSVLPLHGTPYVARADMKAIMGHLVEGPAMDPGEAADGEPRLVADGV